MAGPDSPWLQTLTGRRFDLLAPQISPAQLYAEVPEALAKIARFNGHTIGAPYSVAQHCCIGADYLLRAPGGGIEAAAAFLLHDAHEAYIGDITTPVVAAVDHMVNYFSVDGEAGTAIKLMKARIDEALFQAAGLPLPWPEARTTIVHFTDLRMLATERRWLLLPPPEPWDADRVRAAPIRLTGKFTPWPWHVAADEYRKRLKSYLPSKAVAAMAA